jgi:membrane protease YdiL (CAAX protease family)
VRREGFSDLFLRIGGRTGWTWLVLVALYPPLVAVPAFVVGWASERALFTGAGEAGPLSLPPDLVPAAQLTLQLLVVIGHSATVGTIGLPIGEELGWRGCPLPRMIDAGARTRSW